jgi:hypothetical protein
MNINNILQITLTVVLDKSIITMNNKYCDRLSSKIMHMQINIFNM